MINSETNLRKDATILIAASVIFLVLLNGCNPDRTGSVDNQTAAISEPVSISPIGNQVADEDQNNLVSEVENVGEIISCSPEKIYRGETLTVAMKTPHGIYSAIRREKGGKWFFLYGGEGNEPAWNDISFTKLPEITINTETAYNSTNVEVGEKPEKIFTKTGKYRLMVSREDFGQCDPPWTGMCEVDYVDKKRPQF